MPSCRPSACSAPLPRERGPRAADPPRPPREAHAAVAAAAEIAVAAGGGQEVRRVSDHAGDLPRVPARRARRARAGRAADADPPARVTLVEVETRDRLAVRLIAAVRLRRHLHVRGRHAERRAARCGVVAGSRPAARAARPGRAARSHRPRRARPASRPTCMPFGADSGDRARRPARRAAPGGRPSAGRGRGARARRARCDDDACTTCAASGGPPGADQRARSDGSTPPTPASTAMRSASRRRAACRPCSWRTCPMRWPPARPLRRQPRPVHDGGVVPATASTSPRRCVSWSVRARLSAASCAPAARTGEWCDPEVLRRLRRASLAVLRKEIEPAEARELARFLPGLAGS